MQKLCNLYLHKIVQLKKKPFSILEKYSYVIILKNILKNYLHNEFFCKSAKFFKIQLNFKYSIWVLFRLLQSK